MFNSTKRLSIVWILLVTAIGGCVMHPPGEREERAAATRAGAPFEKPAESRNIPPLPQNPSSDQMVQYALLNNADLERQYWEWRAAIEQILQDGSQSTTFNLAAGTTITRGTANLGSSTIALANDPMTDIKWPGKLDTAAKQALENARATGRRFRKAQFELRAKVLNAYYDYALNAELIRLEQDNHELLQTMLSVTQSRNQTGSAGQDEVLRAANDLDLSTNDIATMQSQLPAQLAAINAILGRAPDAAISVPTELPADDRLQYSHETILTVAANQNPELQALADEIQGRKDGIRLAKLQYVPDFNFSAGTDLMGITQSVLGQATIPIFRYEALNAAIAQAKANLHASEAMLRQTSKDLSARVVADITTIRDLDRQLDLFANTILPRVREAVTFGRSRYETAQATLLDLLDSQRSLIAIERLVANLKITREKTLADLEMITARALSKSDLQQNEPTTADQKSN